MTAAELIHAKILLRIPTIETEVKLSDVQSMISDSEEHIITPNELEKALVKILIEVIKDLLS